MRKGSTDLSFMPGWFEKVFMLNFCIGWENNSLWKTTSKYDGGMSQSG